MSKKSFDKLRKKGVILMEMLLALAIGSAILTTVSSALVGSQQANLRSYQSQQAELHLQEISEAVKSIKLSDWENISINGNYHPEIVDNDWILAEDEEIIGIYKRKIEITDVFRDDEGNIVAEAGTLDPSTKKITTIVSWEISRPSSVSQTFFLTRWGNNMTWIEDTYNDFIDGTEDAVDVVINPGYVQLAETGGEGEWTEPTIIADVDAMAKLNAIWIKGDYLFCALGSSIKKIEVFDISADPENPVSLGSFDTLENVNNLAVNGSYLYAALDNDDHAIQIFDISENPVSPTEVRIVETAGRPSGLWLQNSYLFASIEGVNRVDVYDASDSSNPSFQGSFETSQNTVDVSGSGDFLYVAQVTTNRAMEIFDISDSVTEPVSLGAISTLFRPTGIWLEGNTLYLSLRQKRVAMYTLNANPMSPFLLGIFQTVQNTSDVTALGDYGYVAGMDSFSRAIGVVYIGDSKGISGIYFVYGEYTSSTLDIESQAAFNRISWEGEDPGLTDILFQIAVNDDNLTWNFVGPDGTAGTYFDYPGAIPLNSTLGTYFKYKIILTSSTGANTPVVDKVIVNYSQ